MDRPLMLDGLPVRVTDDGRVFSIDRMVKYQGSGPKWQGERFVPGHEMKQYFDKDGYKIVSLCRNDHRKKYKVHRLVAQAFLPNPDNLPAINHKNEKKDDNRVENLEWCTVAYNNAYHDKSKRCGGASRKAVVQIDPITGEDIAVYRSIWDANKALGVKPTSTQINTVCAQSKPYAHTAYGFKWRFRDEIKRVSRGGTFYRCLRRTV